MPDQTVVITGASSGIGRELAKLFAHDQFRVVLVSRRLSELEELAQSLKSYRGGEVFVLAKDLTEEESPREIYDWIVEKGLSLDILVNNAGFGLKGEFTNISLERQLNMLDLNIRALTELTGLAMPGMLKRNDGGILNVASTAAFQPGPLMAAYYASKAYVLSFTEALHEEVAATNVTVTCLAPGPTRTRFAETAGASDARIFRGGGMDVEQVALAGYRGFRRRRRLVVPGFMNRLGAFSNRLVPRWFSLKLLKRLNS